ncbi:hypothetical protein QQF64_031633 [Cirrhinus molitorella]|uniref:Uncharacterized protein n=1 Tax=Cirrhinus molitorella TaxID=172907 RepID=A0ABR3MXH9_9TELE
METWEEAREEDGCPRSPGKRQEGSGAGGRTRWDPGHSHDDGPRWSRRREEPWRRNGHRLRGGRPTVAEQVEEEPEAEIESQWARVTGRIRRAKAEQMAPMRRRVSGRPRWSWSDRGLRRSRREGGA